MTGKAKSPLPVQSVGQIDLDSHAVIEASAGTGKTHAIEELVVALLRLGKVRSLDEILVMTFTDKAAGELKDRIREGIRKSLKTETSDILKLSLDNFDSASIFTIHGFCNKIIQEYAFENREQFQNELVDDRAVYQRILRQIMRRRWPEQYGDSLHTVLKISNYPDVTSDGRSRWEERVIDVALRYQPEANDDIIPEPVPDLLKTIQHVEQACAAYLDTLLSQVGAIDRDDPARSDLCIRYGCLNIRKNSIPKRIRILAGLLNLIAAHADKRLTLPEIADFFTRGETGDQGFNELNTGWKGDASDSKKKLPELDTIIATVEAMRAFDFNALRDLLAAATIRDIKIFSSEYKRKRGLISYEDMVSRVYSAVADPAGDVIRILRRRYRYALVDEFQDTDMLQWKIFKAIFLGTERNRLFIISDPKQAIYGFRGADINAYYIARDEMMRSYNARYYCLTDNWRSSPALIKAFNAIFGNGNWFTDSKITYLPNHFPRQKDPEAYSEDNCIFAVDCGSSSGNGAKFKNAEFMACEIQRITVGDMLVKPGDIAILVKKWKEAEAVEKSLQKTGIKYSYYKKEGLYQSREALELYYLICSIARPNDRSARKKSLITRFFQVPVHLLVQFDDLPPDHPVSTLFARWYDFSIRKNWPHLFQSIIEDTGILFRSDIDDHDRTILNYRTIIQDILVEAVKRDYTIDNIISRLNDLRVQGSFTHESYNLEKIDVENPGVQIMTIHASKGLQFRVVFIAGGFTRREVADFWTYHRQTERVFDLVQAPVNGKLHDTEISGEEERLFYVAFTRAKDRLYVPVFQPTATSKGTCGILGRQLPSALEAVEHQAGIRWIDPGSAVFQPFTGKAALSGGREALLLPDPLFPDPEMGFFDRALSVESFSGLKSKFYRQSTMEKLDVEFGDTGPGAGEDDAFRFFAMDNGPGKNQASGELPHSIETGLMLHDILERIDFQFVGAAAHPAELLAAEAASGMIIADAVQKHMRYDTGETAAFLKNETARIVWNTLRGKLNDSGLTLCAIDKKMHEVEFYYPSTSIKDLTIPEISYHAGFIHGFIDMVFAYNGRFYMVDWKSNYLEGGYSIDELENSIRSMHYDLQIFLYATALLNWIKRTVPGYSYDAHFGGVYYLYMRGMDNKNTGSGIYYYRPADERQFLNIPSLRPYI